MSPPVPQTGEEIAEFFRGAIRAGKLGDGQRLPTVRQTARDLGVAQATAAKAYRMLESEGLVVTRTAAGTRVAPGASRVPEQVVAATRRLVEQAQEASLSLPDLVAVLRSIWDDADRPPDDPHPS